MDILNADFVNGRIDMINIVYDVAIAHTKTDNIEHLIYLSYLLDVYERERMALLVMEALAETF